MKKTTTTYENPDYLEPFKKIETLKMLEIPKIPEYYEEISECKLMNNVNDKDDTHYLKPLPLSPISKLPKHIPTENKYQPNWLITIALSSITAIIGIHL